MLSQQFLLEQNQAQYSKIDYQNSIINVKADWHKTESETKIQHFIALDIIVYKLKNLGLEYYELKNDGIDNYSLYAKINTAIQHARIELELGNLSESIDLLRATLVILEDHQKVNHLFYPLIHILLALSFNYKNDKNHVEYYINKFNSNIDQFRLIGVHVDSELIYKIQLLLSNKIMTIDKNPFLPKYLKGRDLEFVTQIIQLIDNNIDNENLSVILLSKELNLSPSQLYRKIHSITKYTVAKLIRIVKLDRAKQMLRENETNISGVAHRVAYSASHFTRVFTEQYGINPKEYLMSIKCLNGNLII